MVADVSQNGVNNTNTESEIWDLFRNCSIQSNASSSPRWPEKFSWGYRVESMEESDLDYSSYWALVSTFTWSTASTAKNLELTLAHFLIYYEHALLWRDSP